MMPPGHVAATWGLATLLQKYNPRLSCLDYRLLALSAMAPDLIDKPLALFVFTNAYTSQLVAHSLFFNLALLISTLIFWRQGLPYVLAGNAHLIADRMWRHTESFWWPLFGWDKFWEYKFMNTPEAMVNVYLDIITRYPRVWVIEMIALLFLLWFGWRHRLYHPLALKQFVRTGQVEVSTNRTESCQTIS